MHLAIFPRNVWVLTYNRTNKNMREVSRPLAKFQEVSASYGRSWVIKEFRIMDWTISRIEFWPSQARFADRRKSQIFSKLYNLHSILDLSLIQNDRALFKMTVPYSRITLSIIFEYSMKAAFRMHVVLEFHDTFFVCSGFVCSMYPLIAMVWFFWFYCIIPSVW